MSLQAREIDDRGRFSSHIRKDLRALLRGQEWLRVRGDTCARRKIQSRTVELRRDSLADDSFRLDPVGDPIAELVRVAVARRARHRNVDVLDALRAKARDEVRPQLLGLGPDAVGLVQHDELSRKSGRPATEVLVMKHGVAVLLGIRDPDDRVDAREELVDARAMLRRGRVDVRKVEDRDVRERPVRVVPHVPHVEPPEQRSGLVARALGDPGERCAGRWAAWSGRAHRLAGERVEEARLAHSGAPDQRENIRRPLESEPSSGIREDLPRARGVEPKSRGRVDRVVEGGEARGERHGESGAVAARSSPARARSAAGSATSLS